MDQVVSTTYPGDEEQVTTTYNAATQPASLAGTNTYVSSATYTAPGQLAKVAAGNGVDTIYTYNSASQRLIGLQVEDEMSLSYGYDRVGNVLRMDEQQTVTFADSFDTKNTSAWTYNSYQTVPYGGWNNNVVYNAGTGSSYDANFYRSSYNLSDGEAIQVRFRADRADSVAHVSIETNDDGVNRRFGVLSNDGKIYVQYNNGSGWVYPKDLIADFEPGTWYVIRITLDDNPSVGFMVEVYAENDASTYEYFTYPMEPGKNWRFRHWLYRGITYLDNYLEWSGTQWGDFDYDALNRLTSAAVTGNGTDLYNRVYTYDPIGNLTSKTGVGSYDYDHTLNVSACTPGTPAVKPHAVDDINSNAWTFIYDCNGNMTTCNVGSGASSLTYNAENKLATASAGSTTTTYTYDGDGTLVMKSDAGGVTRYVGPHYETWTPLAVSSAPNGYGVACIDGTTGTGYIMYSEEDVHTRFAAHPPNADNAYHFICVKYNNGWVYDNNLAYYPFDPELTDILVAAVDFTNDTVTLLSGTNTYEHGIAKGYASGNLNFTPNVYNGVSNPGEFGITGTSFTPNSTVVKTYMLGGQRVATRRNGTLFYLHGDHLGSASLTTDASGGVVSEMRYHPYGTTRSGSAPTDRRYTGQREDSYTQLYHMGARWYDAELARWTSPDTIVPDPANPQSLNRFSYVLGNPLRYSDPSGHVGEDEVDEADELLKQLLNSGIEILGDWGWRDARGYKYWHPGSWTLEDLDILNQTATYAQEVSQQVENGELTAVDAFENLVSWRASLGAEHRFVDDISICLLGDAGFRAIWSPPTHLTRHDPTFVAGDSGYREYFQDGSNQSRHFWMYVNAAYVTGRRGFVDWGVRKHEDNRLPWRMLNAGTGTGLDIALGYRGRELGMMLRAGTVNYSEAGNWVQRNLGPEPGAGRGR